LEPVPEEDLAIEKHEHLGGELETHGRVEIDHVAQSDARILRTLIQRHLHYTGSERARVILQNFDIYLPKFVKIMPVEYRRALAEMAAAQEQVAVKAERVSHG
jgi:glutamate synthase (NADPH/NADH) large chain